MLKIHLTLLFFVAASQFMFAQILLAELEDTNLDYVCMYNDKVYIFDESLFSVQVVNLFSKKDTIISLSSGRKFKYNHNGNLFHNFKYKPFLNGEMWQLGLVKEGRKPHLLSFNLQSLNSVLVKINPDDLFMKEMQIEQNLCRLNKSLFEQVFVNVLSSPTKIGVLLYGDPYECKDYHKQLVNPCFYLINSMENEAKPIFYQSKLCSSNGKSYRFYPFTYQDTFYIFDESNCSVYNENNIEIFSIDGYSCNYESKITYLDETPFIQQTYYNNGDKLRLCNLVNEECAEFNVFSSDSEILGKVQDSLIYIQRNSNGKCKKGIYAIELKNDEVFQNTGHAETTVRYPLKKETISMSELDMYEYEHKTKIVHLYNVLYDTSYTDVAHNISSEKDLIFTIDSVLSISNDLKDVSRYFAMLADDANDIPTKIKKEICSDNWEGLERLKDFFKGLKQNYKNISWITNESDIIEGLYRNTKFRIFKESEILYFDALFEL